MGRKLKNFGNFVRRKFCPAEIVQRFFHKINATFPFGSFFVSGRKFYKILKIWFVGAKKLEIIQENPL